MRKLNASKKDPLSPDLLTKYSSVPQCVIVSSERGLRLKKAKVLL